MSLALVAAVGVGAQSHPVYGAKAMAVSVEPHATAVGVTILKQGGNAFDAAAAMGFALAVTYPQAGNLGGGGFAVSVTGMGERTALDFRETAPATATVNMFLDADGNVVTGRSTHTHLASGVPGSVAGLLALHKRYGVLTRAAVLAPAIRLARDGFEVAKSLSDSLASTQPRLQSFPGTAKSFYAQGQPPAFGARLRQPDLARTLQRIATSGRDGFYKGETSRLVAAEMKRHGGLITEADLAAYAPKWRAPFTFEAAGHTVVTMPLPSSGGVTLAQILGLLDLDALKRAGPLSSESIQRMAEAERLAYADRNHYLGDADFVEVPVSRLVSKEYLAERAKRMPVGKAGKSEGTGHGAPESMETTHYTVADAQGNVVAVTTTLNGSYGMGAVVEGGGFLLNNEMDDFTSKPGVPNLYGLVQSEANAIAPGKRMLSSMTPTIVLKDGAFAFTVGSPGGSTIITTVAQVFLNVVVHGMNIRDAIDAGRVHHQHLPDDVQFERTFVSSDTMAVLKEMGYSLRPMGSIGIAAGIQRTPGGLLAGWSDRRASGSAAGY